MKMRLCTKCGQEKPETTEYFHRAKNNRVGLCTICKECKNKAYRRWHAENLEKARDKSRRWHAENLEKARDKSRRWKAENPEKVREACRRWRAKSPEKAMEAVRRWQAENPEKVREIEKRRQAKNPGRQREAKKRYVDTLTPGYLKQLITTKYNIDSSEIGDELINAKRRELKYYRQLKQLKK